MIHVSCLFEFLSVSPEFIIYFISKFKLFMLLLSLYHYVIHVILSIPDSFHIYFLFEKTDANNVMVNKWAVLLVDANTIYCTSCGKPGPINHCRMEQVNQHVQGKTHKSFSDAKFSSSQYLDYLKVLQVFNLPNLSIFRWLKNKDYGLSN